jgi:L-ribulose-5-phosphate 4-epimerase
MPQTNQPDEGYIKFNCQWQASSLPAVEGIDALLQLRNELFTLHLIGFDEQLQVGFGNISLRIPQTDQFIISGTQTGHIALLEAGGLSWVKEYDIDANSLYCGGAAKASSESLTHAAVYNALPNVHIVIHVHHAATWQQWLHRAPTTSADIPYGTPEMAHAVKTILQTGTNAAQQFITMAGHENGLITFGENSADARRALLHFLKYP